MIYLLLQVIAVVAIVMVQHLQFQRRQQLKKLFNVRIFNILFDLNNKLIFFLAKTFPAGPRTKRTYSQTSHHEALQRISSRMSNTSVATSSEWHAPDSFIFDYTGPGVVKTDVLDLARKFFYFFY